MNVKFPQIENILNSSFDENAFSQIEYAHLMSKSNNFFNNCFAKYLDRISRNYNSTSIVNLLCAVSVLLEEEEDACEFQISYDDFVKNASLVSQSLKKIVNFPSTRLVKIDKFLPVNKVRKFDTRTMTWLARRPGITIEEKAGPKGTILTKVTHFTPDTPENRHTMYLYNILYNYLYEKVFPNSGELKCETCEYTNKKCHQLYEDIKSILILKQKIKTSELGEVKKEKQLRQNNKLLSDKEYKQIWDSVRDIDYYEETCKDVWEHLKQRYIFISFLILCATIYRLQGIKLYDDYCTLEDTKGIIRLLNSDSRENTIKFYDEVQSRDINIELIDESIIVTFINYSCPNNVMFVKNSENEIKIDLSTIFDEFDNIEEKTNEYKLCLDNLKNVKSEITKIENAIKYEDQKLQLINKVIKLLFLKIKEENN